MALKGRVKLARLIAPFAKVVEVDRHTFKPKIVHVPGHGGKTYRVIIRRGVNRLSVECHCLSELGPIPCPGNTQTVCYHSMSAVMLSASESGKEIVWTESEKTARKLMNLGGTLVTVKSFNGDGLLYAIVRDGAK